VRRSLFAAVLTALFLLSAPTAHALPARDIAGVAVHPWRMDNPQLLERTFAGIAATGVRWVRVDMKWLDVEPDGPALAAGHPDWSQMDAIVAAAERHGLELLPIVAYVPPWANHRDEPWAYPDSRPFEDFFAAALRRYPAIEAWELWNEPNFGVFAKPFPDPAGFVALLRSARRAANRVGSDAKLVSGGLAPGQPIDIFEWVDAMARLGGLELIDGLGVHPYSPLEPDDPRSWMMRLRELDRRLASLGRPELPLWLTEYGAPSSPVPNGYGPASSEEAQAQRLRLGFALASRLPFVENMIWYEYRDGCADPTVAECAFGLVRDDLSPKPALEAMHEVVGGATARLRPRLGLSSGRLRRVRLVTVRGSLVLPGTARPRTRVVLRLLRRGLPPRRIRVNVQGGTFRARLTRPGRRRWTIEARYRGSPAYEPAVARLRVGH
jgi:hypothetical protein